MTFIRYGRCTSQEEQFYYFYFKIYFRWSERNNNPKSVLQNFVSIKVHLSTELNTILAIFYINLTINYIYKQVVNNV